MPATVQRTYAFKGRAADGKLVKGDVEASNEGAALARLTAMRLSPISIDEKVAGTGLDRELTIGFLGGGVKVADLAIAGRQLATMTASGLSLLRAITVVGEQTENKKLATILQEVSREIETGGNLSDALAHHPQEIPQIMVSMLRAGEAGGFLDVALDAVATTFEKEAKLRSTIKSAMTYPIVVLVIALLAVVGMLLFIVPVFKKMFSGFGAQLPLPTQILVTASDQVWWALPLLAVLLVAGSTWWRAKKDTDAVRSVVHPLLMRVPIFGPLMGKVAVSRFARNLGNMTAAGVPLVKALGVVGKTSGNWVVEKTAEKVSESVRLGKSMAAPLAEEKLFPKMVVQMIAVGEESGSVDVMLGKVADFYDGEIQDTADSLTSLIEPVLITVLGVVVGGMIIALYMPIFSIANVVK